MIAIYIDTQMERGILSKFSYDIRSVCQTFYEWKVTMLGKAKNSVGTAHLGKIEENNCV